MHGPLCALIERNVYAVLREAKNKAIFNIELFAGKEADAIEPAADSIEHEIAQSDYIICAGLDHNAICAAYQDRRDNSAAAVNCDCLGNCESAKACRIQSVNFTAGRGL